MELKLKDETSSENAKQASSDEVLSLPITVVDAALQTESFIGKEEYCQTDSPGRKDFQNQAGSLLENRSITTQTDPTGRQDDEVQRNDQQETEQIPLLQSIRIKQEVAMPNLPNSVGQNQAKKRKLSAVSRSLATSSDSCNVTSSDSNLCNSCNRKQKFDDFMLNSEVYQIYCRSENPKTAMKEIKELKTCISFQEPTQSLPNEPDLKDGLNKALERLWSFGPPGSSKWTHIEKFMTNECTHNCIFETTGECSPRIFGVPSIPMIDFTVVLIQAVKY